MFRKCRVCFGKVRYVLERSGMFRKRAGMFWKGQVCVGKDRYV